MKESEFQGRNINRPITPPPGRLCPWGKKMRITPKKKLWRTWLNFGDFIKLVFVRK